MEWKPLTIGSGADAIECVVVAPAGREPPCSLCIVPAKSVAYVDDPEMKDALFGPLVERGAAVLCFPNHYGDLEQLGGQLRQGSAESPFAAADRRIGALISQCIERQLGERGRIVLIGVSRFGYASLHAMANVSDISAVAAISPVTFWPHLQEFRGLDENGHIQSSDLSRLANRLPPRPLLVQIGTTDTRVSTERCREFGGRVASAYRDRGVPNRFSFQEFDVPGHVSNGQFYQAVVQWLGEQGFVKFVG